MKARSFIFMLLLTSSLPSLAQVTPETKEKSPAWDTTNLPKEAISKHYDSLINECNETIKKLHKYIIIIQQDIQNHEKQVKELVDESNRQVKAAQAYSKSDMENKIKAIRAQLESLNNALKIKLEQVEEQQKRITELEKEKQEFLSRF